MNILVINLGLRSMRAIVFNERGEKLVHSWYPVRTTIKGDHVEQDPHEWWSLCQEVIKEATADERIKNDISAITVTSSACFLVPVDKNGEAVRPSMIVSDKRSHNQAEWLKDNEPANFAKTAKFISSNDYILYKLSGACVTDPLNAEKLYYDQEEKKYPEKLLEFLGIKEDHMPEVKPVGFVVDNLKAELK